MTEAYIYGINGPVIKVKGDINFQMTEMVMVGNDKLIGEVIGVEENETIVQVYEVTSGLKTGEPVYPTGKPLSVQLGPGIIGNIFDGIQRPLKIIEEETGEFIGRGLHVDSLDRQKKWETKILAKKGDNVQPGTIIAEINETDLVIHKIMVPYNVRGDVIETAQDGQYAIDDVILKVKDNDKIHEVSLVQEWPVRKPREYKVRRVADQPLITGQRVIDSIYPIAKGGTAAIPGGFGTGKTMTQHQLAKWSDADIIVYIGCGERGNEITEVLEDFPELIDPKTNKPLMDRTILIANTSNMPVAAREASIYTGITLAEYFRDMGYHVAVMADSTSRWAEALREISGRLEEMPAEEGFPAYLPSRLSQFYERASYVENLNGTEGSVSIIGAVSPQGGDFSEPVTQNTKRFIRCFWALDRELAYSRHYPAIHWLNSYSEYIGDLEQWYLDNVDKNFINRRTRITGLLQEESNLMEIVKLIGSDVLPEDQKLILEIARAIRLGFLQQNAFHKVDTFVPIIKQYKMMNVILYLYDNAKKLVKNGIPVSQIREKGIFDEIINIKYHVENDRMDKLDKFIEKIDQMYKDITEHYKDMDLKRA